MAARDAAGPGLRVRRQRTMLFCVAALLGFVLTMVLVFGFGRQVRGFAVTYAFCARCSLELSSGLEGTLT